jgi:hypothetical protein
MLYFAPVRLALTVTLLLQAAALIQAASGPQLHLQPRPPEGWPRLSAPGQTGMVYTVQASTNLSSWTPIATTHDAVVEYPDAAAPLFPERFYRLTGTNQTAADDWKNQVTFPGDAFLSPFGEAIGPDFRWIKFAIPFNEPYRIYYQDSRKYPFHYDFATARLEGFRGMTPAQFDQVALRTNQQQILLGTLLIPPAPVEGEYGIQFVGQDAYPPALVAQYYDLVKATVVGNSNANAFYVPAFEQMPSAETNRAYFESKGIRLATAERWVSGDDIYSTGWALGRLKFVPGAEINAAFRDGLLAPGDILLTDGVPAEIPVLAGVLTLTPSTPNSHVAILSKSFGLPFAYISDADLRARVQELVGKDIVLRLDPFRFQIKVTELEPSMDPALRAEILSLRLPPKLSITPKAKYGKISASTDALTPADIQYFGGKASNFGFLRRQIPDRSPSAIALSFDLWDEFLDQVLPSGKTLRSEIDSRLSKHTYPANAAQLQQDLADIRSLITRTARFTEAQQQAILEALRPFDGTRNIRFRSSTNVEDSEQFTGAGLYDSFSGCPADDQDEDTHGPSRCDPTETDERGVFRAIQKVYASFYNNNAVLERLRHQVDERTVGMAILVHYSAPDETELANGVATLQISRGAEFGSVDGDLVTQKGAVSVTNPDGTARPEVVQGYHHNFGVGGFLKQRSSLVPLGAYVMDWKDDYVALMNLFAKVADGYHAYFTNKTSFTLDFEYKKLVPGVLDVKQVREVPVINPTNMLPAFLVHETNSFWVMQGEAADVFSNHRLKSFWAFRTRNTKLTETNLVTSLFADLQAEFLESGTKTQLAGAPASFPNASHRVDGEYVIDAWTSGTGAEQRTFELKTIVPREIPASEPPVFTLPDLRLELVAEYATPQPALEWDMDGLKQVMVKSHAVVLEPRRVLTSTNHLQKRVASSADGMTVHTEFYWPAPPGRGIGDKTAPLVQWKETKIEGLTTQPITLRGEYSQTYRPGHHNFSEEFIFEPALEEGLSAELLAELQAANVQLIHVQFNFEEAQIRILGLDGNFRALSMSDGGKPKPGE